MTVTTLDQELNFSNYLINSTLEHESNKKKKASRACLHCQRAHLTCDDSRPCQRCVRRDLANTCTDAARKRAKYLQDIPTDEIFSSSSSVTSATPAQTSIHCNNNDSTIATTQAIFPTNTTTVETSTTNALFDFSLSDLGFGSETVGLEYGFIGNMLQNPLLDMTNSSSPMAQQQHMIYNTPYYNMNQTSPFLQQPVIKEEKRLSNASSTSKRKSYTPEEAYTSVKRPFNYAEGFHYLIRYVTDKMGRDDLMKISRALALFRPSFLALIMNLTEEDLVFMEKCLQRTLLEYEKLISFSGTPTVVWRRTGEICLVGKEFSLLTQWNKDMLLGKKTYIYELMDSQSAVEYWEKFSTHAFDNTDKSCVYSCIIKTPQLKPVPCTFCFTIKRDIFDLPSVIIGNVSFYLYSLERGRLLTNKMH